MKEDLYNQQEIIQQYLSGKLSESDRQALEEEFKNNAELQEEVELFRQLKNVGEHAALFELQNKLAVIKEEVPLQPDLDTKVIDKAIQSGRGGWSTWFFLGGIVALITIGSILVFRAEVFETDWVAVQEVSQEYLQPFENVISYDPAESSAISLGMSAYDQADYNQAAQQLRRAIDNVPEVQLYLGISLLLDGSADPAIQYLQRLAADQASSIQNAAIFYLALAHIEVQQETKAEELLKSLTGDSQFGAAAQEILAAF